MRNFREELTQYIADYVLDGIEKGDYISNVTIEDAIDAFEDGSSNSGDRFKVEISIEEEENIPCVSCGEKSKPLHTNYKCPDCFEMIE